MLICVIRRLPIRRDRLCVSVRLSLDRIVRGYLHRTTSLSHSCSSTPPAPNRNPCNEAIACRQPLSEANQLLVPARIRKLLLCLLKAKCEVQARQIEARGASWKQLKVGATRRHPPMTPQQHHNYNACSLQYHHVLFTLLVVSDSISCSTAQNTSARGIHERWIQRGHGSRVFTRESRD